MKSNRNWLAGSLLGAAAVCSAAMGISIATAAEEATPAAPAAPGPHAWHHHHGEGRLLAKLNLSAEQQAAVKTIMTNAGPQMKSLHQEMRANSLKLRQTQPNDPNYANVVAQVTQANGALHSQLITQKEAVRAQVFKVLTPAQQTQLAALQAQMQAQR
jgi:protein CpxP